MKQQSILGNLFFTLFMLAVTVMLAMFALGVANIGMEHARFGSEKSGIAEVKAYSNHYSQQKNGWETDVSFVTENGRTVYLREELVDSEEKAVLEEGGTVQRQYLLAEPWITKRFSEDASGSSEYWLAGLFAVGALFNLGALAHHWKKQIKMRRQVSR